MINITVRATFDDDVTDVALLSVESASEVTIGFIVELAEKDELLPKNCCMDNLVLSETFTSTIV
jgi:hypothetical protein